MAARFGMTREAVEELLHQTHAEYPDATMPPMEPAAKTPIELAEEKITNTPEPVATPPLPRATTKPLGGGFLAAIFIVLLIVLGVALSFSQGCFHRRIGQQAAKPIDTIQTLLNNAASEASSPPQPTNVAPGQVPPEALIVPREEPPGTSGPPSNSGITTEAQALKAEQNVPHSPTFVTSSNFEAEEELARLHAEGRSHAHLRSLRTRGGIRYRVFSK
jgi:hypothetical protein